MISKKKTSRLKKLNFIIPKKIIAYLLEIFYTPHKAPLANLLMSNPKNKKLPIAS